MKDRRGFIGAISNYKGGTGKTITSVACPPLSPSNKKKYF